jgi:UDP-N-acetylglucosamine--N-acetylmuramyl-(pentapeptide) pyrophosphoryl-undecaprenol N-acetylglucosamine transferase
MGGFTSAPPVLAGREAGAKTFLHESNSIAGRANRWLSRFVDAGFIYFPQAHERMRLKRFEVTGMPVRPSFLDSIEAISAKMALGLNPKQPVLLAMGGSQGASGVNQLVTGALPLILKSFPDLQVLHFTGSVDFNGTQQKYAELNCRSVIKPFFTEMELALAAATVCVSRSGASSLAEIAALRVPSILVPYPTAADDHQLFNAKAFVDCGAALMAEQKNTTPLQFAEQVIQLLKAETKRNAMRQALSKWHFPKAAGQIADRMLASIGVERPLIESVDDFPRARIPSVVAMPAGSKNFFAPASRLPEKAKEANV